MSQKRNIRQAVVILSTLCMLTAAQANERAKSPFEFSLRSHEGREWTNDDFAEKEFVVVAFLGTECPLVKLYGPRLQKLSDEFQNRVAFVGLNSNTQDSLTEISAYANRHKISFPLLKDTNNVVADQFGAERTPEVFLLDRQRKVRYQGRIDDQYSVGTVRDQASKEDLRDAIEELLAGKDVSTPKTESVGCHIGRVQKAEPQGDITFTKHIAPIFYAKCVECHREGELAPFPLLTYDDVIGWEETICEVIEDNRMPPWFANPEHGKFQNDCRLTDEEKQTVYQWVDNGMPKGDEADMPKPPSFYKGWRIGEPDQVFYMRDEPFRVKPQGTIDYQHFLVDPGWTEDKYISAAEARPENKSVVHHILVYILPPDAQPNPQLDQILVGYAPGSTPVELEDGIALKVPAGSKLLFQMHYTPNGYEETDRSFAGVKFADKDKIRKLIQGRVAIETDFAIPPNAKDFVVKAPAHKIHSDQLLVSMTPHMHLRGASFKYEARFPDGSNEILLDVPKYDFNWQIKYILEEPRLLPRGTTIHCTAIYDNSEDNLVNPDPSQSVRWGDQSWQEMMIGFFDTLPASESTPSGPRISKTDLNPNGVYRSAGRMPGKLTLELKNDSLSGTFEAFGMKTKISQAQVVGDRLSFEVRPPQMPGVSFGFNAKFVDDALQGEVIVGRETMGRSRTRPWNAEKQ